MTWFPGGLGSVDPGEGHAPQAVLQQPLRVPESAGGTLHVRPRQPAHVSALANTPAWYGDALWKSGRALDVHARQPWSPQGELSMVPALLLQASQLVKAW